MECSSRRSTFNQDQRRQRNPKQNVEDRRRRTLLRARSVAGGEAVDVFLKEGAMVELVPKVARNVVG